MGMGRVAVAIQIRAQKRAQSTSFLVFLLFKYIASLKKDKVIIAHSARISIVFSKNVNIVNFNEYSIDKKRG